MNRAPRGKDGGPVIPDMLPAFDPSTRGPAFTTPEGVFMLANLYTYRHKIPDRYAAAADLAHAWLAAHDPAPW